MLYQLSYQSLLPVWGGGCFWPLNGKNSKTKQKSNVLQEGLEPPTLGLLDPCSTN